MNILSDINAAALADPIGLIATAEEAYDNELNRVVEQVLAAGHIKIILLAGPSGSGKTTTAHILRDKLTCRGHKAQVVSLDHFYLAAEKMPRQENGQPDFETVYSLDIPEIHRVFSELITTEATTIPTFDFKTKKRGHSHPIDISDNGLLIVEGLHALNPILTDRLAADCLFKIYISANQKIYDDEGKTVLSSRQIRLARRMSRDFIYRNTTASETLRLWTAVVAGEEKYLYCYKGTADVLLKTFHSFEPCIFRNIILDLLQGLDPATDNYEYVMRVKRGLERFFPLEPSLVPETSLIREFIEGGVYEERK